MKYEKDERGGAGGYAMAAAIDAKESNKRNYHNFTAEQHKIADEVAVMAAAAYNGSIYKNPRKKVLTVSAHGRRNHAALEILEKFCEKHEITGSRTANGTHIYHIK
jgi:hypothetical protein